MSEVAGQGAHSTQEIDIMIDNVDTGILEVLLHRLPNCIVEQSCLPKWSLALSTTRIDRHHKTSSCRVLRKAAALGDEQYFDRNRRA